MKMSIYPRSWLGAVVRIALFTGLMLSVYVLLQRDEHHVIPQQKVAALAMLQSLSEAKSAASACQKSGIQFNACGPLHIALQKLRSKDRYFFVADDRALVGIDFPQNVVVEITPNSTTTVQWRCAGQPAQMMPTSCDPIE